LQADAIAGHGKTGSCLLGWLKIMAGAESMAAALNYQKGRRIIFELVQGPVELAQYFLRHRIEFFGSVQRQPENLVFACS
jgi:hypothetical protein